MVIIMNKYSEKQMTLTEKQYSAQKLNRAMAMERLRFMNKTFLDKLIELINSTLKNINTHISKYKTHSR